MNRIKTLITQLTEFGINPNVDSNDKIQDLRILLIGIYLEYLNVKPEFDVSDYDESPDYDYNEINQNVKSNFPDFDWYSMILDSNKLEPNIEIGCGDELDDLTDIIKDLLEVKWRMENTSEKDAIWYFELMMRTHSEQHLVDLVKRLKERNE